MELPFTTADCTHIIQQEGIIIQSRSEGLDGAWYKATDPNSYQFFPNGKVVVRNMGLESEIPALSRFDNIIEVCDHQSEGDWSFTGEVKSNEIQGQFVGYDESGRTAYSVQDEWRRVPPESVS